jgi:uncharacterized protein
MTEMDDTTPTSPDSLIPYDDIVQESLRAVVRTTLRLVEKEGLPGAHHFYIAFKTAYAGVQVPRHLRERYPQEMTIVVQHRFWDLRVYEDRFEIGLSFNQRPETLIVPFAAIVGFVDPAVNFALQFQAGGETILQEASTEPDTPPEPEPAAPGGNVVTLDRFRKK